MTILCPNCHRPFTKELEKENTLSQKEEEGESIDPVVNSRAFSGFVQGMENETSLGDTQPVHVAEVTYEEHYKCSHCGHEWTEIKKKEGTIEEK